MIASDRPGSLEGQGATTHWAYCDAMARRHPSVRMYPHRVLVASGEGERLIMAGGGTTWMDLALFLVARLVGVEEAMHLARLFLIDWHQEGQLPYAACYWDDAAPRLQLIPAFSLGYLLATPRTKPCTSS